MWIFIGFCAFILSDAANIYKKSETTSNRLKNSCENSLFSLKYTLFTIDFLRILRKTAKLSRLAGGLQVFYCSEDF